MVTFHVERYIAGGAFRLGTCLSTDVKPTTDPTMMNGSRLREIDTSKEYYYNEEDRSWEDGSGYTHSVKPNVSPSVLQRIVSSGQAAEYYSIGDEINIPWTDYNSDTPVTYEYPFVVVDIADAYDENDVKHENAVWLMAKYAEPQEIPFDVAESIQVDLSTEPNALADWYYWGMTGNSYTALNLSAGDSIPTTYDKVYRCSLNDENILRYGYNRWKYSAYRQWLNSDAAKNAGWWTSQHTGDVAPDPSYINKPGWLYGFTDEWKAIFRPVKVQTACNIVTDGGVTDVTYDKFFLPSIEQMYGSPQIADVEGKYWPYWKDKTGLTSPSNAANNGRKVTSIASPTGSAVTRRLRSANRDYGNFVWNVFTSGFLNAVNAYTAYLCQPACVIY